MSFLANDMYELETLGWDEREYHGRHKIYARAFDHYGCEMQRMVAIEEMSELIKELCKLQRDQTTMDRLVDEITDVEIMIEQLKMMFDVEETVRKWKSDKLIRLYKRMEEDLEEWENNSYFAGDDGTDLVCDVGDKKVEEEEP